MKKTSKKEILIMLEKSNYKLVGILEELGVSKINLISCGNSIATGYSMSSFTKPLLLRNESIETIIKEKGIELKRYHFARPQDNNDEHVYSWLINDVPLSVINKLNRFDIVSMNEIGIDSKKADEYYPLDDETTLNSLLNSNASNVIVYNGATGSFLDNVTRNGTHYFTHGIKRDCTSIESFLKYVQEMNREKGISVQIYLCGAPKLLGMSDLFINTRLKKMAEKYANVTYVENINKKLFYKKNDGTIIPDLHYDENEFLIFNNQIIDTISKNYLLNKILIEIDRKLFLMNKEYQLGNIEKDKMSDILIEIVLKEFYKNKQKLDNQDINIEFLFNKIKKYLLERYQYDFYYFGKTTLKNINMQLITEDKDLSNRNLR